MKNSNIENLETLRKLEDATPRAVDALLELLESPNPRIKLAAAPPERETQTLESQIELIENWSKNNETSPSIQPEHESEFYAQFASET